MAWYLTKHKNDFAIFSYFIISLIYGQLFVSVNPELPTDGVSTLSWWWGLSAPETLRAMLAVA
jgi:hypothetical protein